MMDCPINLPRPAGSALVAVEGLKQIDLSWPADTYQGAVIY